MATGLKSGDATKDRLTSVLVTDFCPWANRYVYWLKEPIGWFVMAFAISVLVALHISAVGWVLASVLGSVIVVGMIWPWIVVRAAHCELRPAVSEIHEGQSCELVLAVRNRMPFPLWGLAIEGYLDRHGDDAKPTIALACVPMISEADYRLRVSPTLRGIYPIQPPKIACSMPFGLWTARRNLAACQPLTVFPRITRVQDDPELSGGRMSETGDGNRVGQVGEMLGVREYRGGDRLRNVHWIHTARTGTLTVCERGAPQQQVVDVVLDVANEATGDAARRDFLREAFARRVRVAASLANALHGHHVPVRMIVGNQVTAVSSGSAGRRKMLASLAEVPADGVDAITLDPSSFFRASRDRMTLTVTGDSAGYVEVQVERGGGQGVGNANLSAGGLSIVIAPETSLQNQLSRFWRDVCHVRTAA
jgi:uncharacterized protein (DUF58 family)